MLHAERAAIGSFLDQLALDDRLRGDAGVIGSGKPQDVHPCMRRHRATMS
jgi:hypothetical protein